jgi:hypothetical protein
MRNFFEAILKIIEVTQLVGGGGSKAAADSTTF